MESQRSELTYQQLIGAKPPGGLVSNAAFVPAAVAEPAKHALAASFLYLSAS